MSSILSSLKSTLIASEVLPPTVEARRTAFTENNKGINVDDIAEEDLPYVDLTVRLTDEEIEYGATSKVFKVKKFFWDGVDKHPKEQRYLLKLDFFLLTSSCLGYFIKNLNQTNVTTA